MNPRNKINKITVVCPECDQHIQFYEIPGYINKFLTCPSCLFKARVNVYMRKKAPAPLPPPPGPRPPIDEQETILDEPPKSNNAIGQLRVKSTGEVQFLKVGRNIVGRRTIADAGADIKISNDPYISRRHVDIEIHKKDNSYEHYLVELGSTNKPLLNNVKLSARDMVKIKFGDVIRLGETDLVFESGLDDPTIIL